MVNNKIGFAVIGYGGMGSWHTRKVKEEMGEYAELVGIYDINPERGKVAEENGIDYVVLSSNERKNLSVNENAFAKLDMVYNSDGIKLYKVK